MIPLWVGVGGTPDSFVRAGTLGLPLMIAIIGGNPKRFKPLIDLYKNAAQRAGHDLDTLSIGVHALGYVEENSCDAKDAFFPGYKKIFTKIGQERGWSATTREHFDSQVAKDGALLVGSPDDVIEKIKMYHNVLGGISRLSFQMNVAALPHEKLLKSIDLIGKKIKPAVDGM